MNVSEWLTATSPFKPGLTASERQAMRDLRQSVLSAAETTINSVRVGVSKDSIGLSLTRRLAAATKGSMYEIKVYDQFPD